MKKDQKVQRPQSQNPNPEKKERKQEVKKKKMDEKREKKINKEVIDAKSRTHATINTLTLLSLIMNKQLEV